MARRRPPSQATVKRVLDARDFVLRHGLSVDRAAREAHTTPRTMRRVLGSSMRRRAGEWVIRRADDVTARMRVPDPERGSRWANIEGSRRRKEVGRYWNAVRLYLEGKGDARLRQFEGRSVTDANGVKHTFVTDRRALKRLAGVKKLPHSVY
jgi:hypothetical protein